MSSIFEAFILGLVQGLTEFLPVSSSGHIELAKALLGMEAKEDMTFTIVVHGATVLSTIVVFWKDILSLFTNIFKFEWNNEAKYLVCLVISMIPILIVGLFFKDQLEAFFTGNILLVGFSLLFTAAILTFSHYAKPSEEKVEGGLSSDKGNVGFKSAFVIGLAQAFAVLPGVSRSGSTIATGLILGLKKSEATKFSFLMVLAPILGANLLELLGRDFSAGAGSISPTYLLVGFLTAFITGIIACKFMIKVVKKGKLIYFAGYCLLVGLIAIFYSI